MSPFVHFYTADLKDLFHVIGSADRDLLQEIGVHVGAEFRSSLEDEEEEEEYPDEEEGGDSDWDYEEVEEDTAKEIVTKLIMSGLPFDLAEDEAYAVQDFLASYAMRNERVHPLDADDVIESQDVTDKGLAEALRKTLVKGADLDDFGSLLEYLQEHGASHDLQIRTQMLQFGRLPEADDPTFTDLEDEAYAARFGYLYAREIGGIVDEIDEVAQSAVDEIGYLPAILSTVFSYCNAQSEDLLVVVED